VRHQASQDVRTKAIQDWQYKIIWVATENLKHTRRSRKNKDGCEGEVRWEVITILDTSRSTEPSSPPAALVGEDAEAGQIHHHPTPLLIGLDRETEVWRSTARSKKLLRRDRKMEEEVGEEVEEGGGGWRREVKDCIVRAIHIRVLTQMTPL
jgi:hypothetical protein